MNTIKYIPAVALLGMAMLTGCDENAWNDKLDGFDASFTPTQVKALEYTLTDADYGLISSNATNKALAAADGNEQALNALSGNRYFTEKITAAEYVPAFLASTSSPFFTLTDGSSIMLTYREAVGLPEEVTEAAGAWTLSVSEEFYKEKVWESDENYIVGFAPEKPASRYLPTCIRQTLGDMAQDGQYAIISYLEASQNPVFGNVGGGEEPGGFTMSDVLASVQPGDNVSVDGVVGGTCTAGFVLTDQSGSIFVYMGSNYDPATYPVGSQLHLEGSAVSFKNNLQIAQGADISKVGEQEYSFPAPVAYDGAALDAALSRPANVLAQYATISGKVIVSSSNINIELDGASTAMGSVYYATDAQKAELTDGKEVILTGWFISISGSRYCNFVVSNLESATNSKAPVSRSVAAPVPTEEKLAVYRFDGSAWTIPADFVVLNPADYAAMGMTDNTLSDATFYLPMFLKQKFPYAKAEDSKFVLYRTGSSGYTCSNYIFNGSEWTLNDGIETKTSQFVRADGKWMFDPNVTINLPYGKGQAESVPFYQACVEWVYENKCVPLGDTSIKSGKYWVTSYGNNDYYCGASYYQNNIDLRAGSARAQYAAGWEGYTDEEIVATMEERCDREVFPAVLDQMYPDAQPVEGFTVVYTINFYAYAMTPDGKYKTLPCWAKYQLVSKGHFEYLESEWLIGME